MASKTTPLAWAKNRGRNGWDHPLDVGLEHSVESRNVILYHGGLGTKRAGAESVSLSGMSGINALISFVPGQDETDAELFMVDNSATKKILRSVSTSFSNLTLKDNVASEAWNVFGVELNGKLHLFYDSTVNRSQVFDPDYSTTAVRRSGMGTPAAPSAATQGGSGKSFTRWYKVAYTEQRSSVTVRRSELSDPDDITITDDTGVTITKPAAISEGETHWELYASDTETGTYYLIATTVVGTTTVSDTAATIDTTTAEPTVGSNTPFPSCKFPATDGKRLLGFGVWETAAGDSLTPKAGRVFFTPVLDSSAIHDDERISNTTSIQGWIDVARNSGAVDRGITPRPLNGVFYVFLSRGISMLIGTENAIAPYRRVVLSNDFGAVNQQSIVMGTDRLGRACCYFLDPDQGPMIIGQDGLRSCGKDVRDIWDTVNKDATTLVAWGCAFPGRNLVLFALATGSSNDPDTIIALDPTEQTLDAQGDLRGGWVTWDGNFADSRCAVLFSDTLAATRSLTKVPYVGLNSGTVLLRYNEANTDDGGTDFQGYVKSGVLVADPRDNRVQRVYVAASAETGVTLTHTFIRGFGDETNRTSTVVLTAAGSETDVVKKAEDAALVDAWAFQVQIGDGAAQDVAAWSIHRWWGEAEQGALK